MILRNFTPFPHLVFESTEPSGRDFGVLVLKGTFDIVPGGKLKPRQEQDPIQMVEEYAGDPGVSSLLKENDLAPFKPKTDIHITAVAHSPDGNPRKSWKVSVEIGKLKKELEVHGPRGWIKGIDGWTLKEAMAVTEVPINYESAYGGRWTEDDKVEAFLGNPAGAGFVNKKLLDPGKAVMAPSIVPVGGAPPVMNREMKVEGLGPIGPSWSPRVALAGTYDEAWKKTKWPKLPDDFDYAFFNTAHPDLIYPEYLFGNEQVVLKNCASSTGLSFQLPDYLIGLLQRFENGQLVPSPMNLDTLHLDVVNQTVHAVWRGRYLLDEPMRVLEVRLREEGAKFVNAP